MTGNKSILSALQTPCTLLAFPNNNVDPFDELRAGCKSIPPTHKSVCIESFFWGAVGYFYGCCKQPLPS